MIDAEIIKKALRCGRSGCPCGKGPNVHCPAHDDRKPSFTIHQQDNKILLNCKSGCSQKAVVETLKNRGLWVVDELDSPRKDARQDEVPPEKPMAIYEYKDAGGNVVAVKGRFEYQDGRKSFRWKLPSDRAWDGLKGQLSIADIPLWGVDSLSDRNGPVLLVEGEKAALACREHGLLTVTHAGGASTTNFGDSLLALKGRAVVLWPDNDEPGRTYMARLHSALRPIAKSLTIISPPLPEKGDAWDYFQAGGQADALLRGVPVAEPVVDYLAHDSIRVRMPSPISTVHITFSAMEKTSRELASEVEVCLDGGGDPFSQRLNLLSGSQVTEMRRVLETIFGKNLGWPQLLNTAIAKARKAFLEQDRATRMINIPEPGIPEFLIPDLLPEGVPTVWFGNGSSLKTYMALRAAISVASGCEFLGAPVRKGAAMLIDYENPPETFRFRCFRLFAGMGLSSEPDLPIFHWPARGIPLADQIEAIREKVNRDGITLLIVDSGAAACGGEPEKANIALSYFLALQKLGLGVTTLTVAHCAKGSDEMMPFGSIFWHNQPRRTVNFQRTDDEDTDDIEIGVFIRKVNDGKKAKPMSFHVRFEDQIGPVTITRSRIQDVPELSAKRSLKDQAWDVLIEPMTAADILEECGLEATKPKIKSLRNTLRREKGLFMAKEVGKGRGDKTLWARIQKS